jgi:PAS domain S-box-containing protein
MASNAADLQRALENDEFFPVFQPIVELRTGQTTGVELLARWRPNSQGIVSPEQFVPQIEKSGLINCLTKALLEKAFASAALVASPLHLAVNLSALQLQDPGLPGTIAACARRGGFALNRLTLEVTESALLEDLTRAREVVRELKQLGCRLALDDFGTGYSSLRHLESLPFDKLKVDRSFVSSMTTVRESRKIVAAVVGLGQSLGMMTVAEGVETSAQASMLLFLGCDLGQGWLYGRPAEAEAIPQILTAPPRMFASAMPAATDGSPLAGVESLPAERLAQIQAIYDGAPVGLCFLDRKMRYVSLNRRLAEINGTPLWAHLGKTVAEVIPHVWPIVEPYIRRALAGEAVMGVEAQKPPHEPGGPQQTVMLSYQPARDEAGEVLGVSVAVMDVTAYKRTEEALRESIDHFRHLMELGPHVPWVLNTRGEVIEASSRWEEVTGQPLSEATGHGWLKMLHPDDIAPTNEAIQLCLTKGEPIDVHYRVKALDGEWLLMRSRGSARIGRDGKIVGVYGVVEAVTQAESEVQRLAKVV